MGILKFLGIGNSIAKPIEAVSKLYTTDKDRLNAETKLEETLQKPILAQMDINKTFALSSAFFQSSWQPLIGWTSGACIALYYVPQLIVINYLWISNCINLHVIMPFPIEPTDILNLVYLLFGFGTYHIVKSKLLGK